MTFETTYMIFVDIILLFGLIVMILAKPGPKEEKD